MQHAATASLLCLTFDNNLRFPPNRAELYEDALETLLRKWDSNRSIQRDEIYRELSHKRKLQLLMSIAVPNFQKGELFFRQRDLEKWLVEYLAKLPNAQSADMIDGATILKAMEAQHSILVERAQGVYAFSHLTFQEYLTARSIAENQGRGVVGRQMYSHLTESRWREVFLLIASLLDEADEFISAICSAVEVIIADSNSLQALLTWADARASLTHVTAERRATVQLAYVFLDLAISRVSAIASAGSRDLALDRAAALARALDNKIDLTPARDLAQAQSRSRTRELVRDSTIAYTLARLCDLARESMRALSRSTIPQVGSDYGLYYTWCYATLFADVRIGRAQREWRVAMRQLPGLVEETVTFASAAGLDSLKQQLVDQVIPLPDASAQVWQQYADALFTILRDQRALGDPWSLRSEEIDKFKDYFYTNELLVQCLKVATISNRQAILNGLLLPPRRERRTEIKGRDQL